MLSLSLSVRIDPNSGFCFGVIYAIQMAEDLLDEQGYLYCLGDIVHNDEEVQRLQRRGLRIICHEQLAMLRDEAVLIRAHGEPPSTYQMALKNNLTLVDASCPVVLKLQNRIKTSFDKREQIFIYGKHGHAEVLGLLGQTGGQAVVFESLDELLTHELPTDLTLYSQTTKSTDSFYRIKGELEGRGYRINANDTICRQVSNRDKDLAASPRNTIKWCSCRAPKAPMARCCTKCAKTRTRLPTSSPTWTKSIARGSGRGSRWASAEPRVRQCG